MAILYSNQKFLQFPEHLAALRAGQVTAPVHIRIKPTNRCNHNCWFCAYRVDNLQLGQDMNEQDEIPEPKMMEIIDDIVAMGVRAVTFSGGGEPTIYKPLPQCIEKLAAGGIRVAALTNGSNLKGRVADAFATHGTWVRVSVDAWADAPFAKSRGIADGSFTRLMANIRDFTARKSKCVLGISLIVTKENHRHITEICAMMKEAGANHVKVAGAVVDNDVAGNNAYHREITQEVRSQIEAALPLTDSSFTVLDHYHDLEERFEKSYRTCPFLTYLTVIGADQKVYTCQDKAYTVPGTLGDISGRGFKDFWFSEENRARIFGFDPSQSCKHHCVTHAKNLAVLEALSIDPEHGLFV